MYVANTRSSQYIHAIKLDATGNMVGRSIFADMNEGAEPGIPDGLKVDSIGRVYCTGPGGIWVISAAGQHLGVISVPEVTANMNWGDDDWRTLYITASSSIYRLRAKVAGNRVPYMRDRA